MFTQSLLVALLVSLNGLAFADQFGNLEKDIASLENAHSDIANSVYAWAATESAVPTNVLENQFDAYFDNLVSETTAPVPGFLTYLPTPLQTPASELLVSEASLVASVLAPSTGLSTGGRVKTTVASMTSTKTSKMSPGMAGTAGTTGLPSMSGNATVGPPKSLLVPPMQTTSSPKVQSKSAASQVSVILLAAEAAVMGVFGVMLFL